jgi:amidase
VPHPAASLLVKPAIDIAAEVRSGAVTSRELVEAALERIEARNPELNAVIQLDADRALAAADAVGAGDARPFAGVPTLIKENRGVEGLRLSYGAGLMGDFRALVDHNVTRRLREAGMIIVGQSNLPEYGILPVSEPQRFGPSRNPWDPERTPGGSSGGAGAAVAGGMVPVAHGNDGGGSIRIPAACCGLVGLKPSRGRVSVAPELGESFLVADGMLTRTVADTAALLDVLAGSETGDATWAPPPAAPFAAAAAQEPGTLRVAMTLTPPIDCPVDPIALAAVRDAAALLESLGHEVEEIDVGWQIPELLQLFSVVFGANIALSVAFAGHVSGETPSAENVEPMSWAIYELASQVNAHQFLVALYQLQGFARQLVTDLDTYDALLTPALAQRPVPIGEIDASSDAPLDDFAASGRFTPFTTVFNVTGQPAISLPFAQGEDGLPVGIQLAGRPAGEAALLALAAQIEAARPWAGRRPGGV